ncbi:hypothetical protein IAT38_008142 [Cryptococcus sp. DSM 104549]
MDQVNTTRDQVHALLNSIKTFSASSENATYRAPVIDWHHPDSYRQSAVAGLKKFLGAVENERDYIDALAASELPPRDLATNAPHLLAVWEEVEKAEWPLACVSQVLEGSDGVQAKVDVVAKGGNEWVKVNTIKESRLMAEFREQDSYINSDYDSDSDDDTPTGSLSRPPLTNSAIEQAASLVQAAKSYPRLPGLPPPTVKYVLNRLEEHPSGGYTDPRVHDTFAAIRSLGAELVLGSDDRPAPQRLKPPPLVPTTNILLDLSVVVALCCDSTHLALPSSPEELEARFRALQLDEHGELSLGPHIPVTKDLRDQLEWEMQRPLVTEMQERLATLAPPPVGAGTNGSADATSGVTFWVTEEVRDRLPGIANVIGGEGEKRRARVMFSGEGDFWEGSRWQGKEGILSGLKVNVLPPSDLSSIPPEGLAPSPFQRGFASVCQSMLAIVEQQASASPLPPPPPPPKANKHTGSRQARRPQQGITMASRLPSAHTLRTFLSGLEKRMTVLTNNRGAVGKVIREMGVGEGLPYGEGDMEGKAVVWVVNPSSLSEWRRKEVEGKNRLVREEMEARRVGGTNE